MSLSSISAPFIQRPVATTLLMVGLMLGGLTGYFQLPVAALPQVDYPTIVVTTQLPGASADTMASAVTTPLERQFGQVPSLTQMTSVSSFGSSQITLQFDLDRDIDAAEQDVQAAINAATNLLPRTLPAPPTYAKSNPADQPIMTLAISSKTLGLPAVSDFADSVLAQKISQVTGVGLVTMGGGQKPAVRVQVDPRALAGTGLTLEDVRSAIATTNVNQPKGNIDGPRQDWAIATNDQLADAASFRPLIIAYKNGAAIRLGEVANVIDDVENSQLAGWSGTQRAVILNVQRQPGANIIEVTDDIKALLPRLHASMPQAIDIEIISDRTITVRASVHEVQFTLALTVFLVIAVIYLFLGSWRATVIPGVAVPLALIGTFGVMKLVGYSLDNLSLMALTISTGFIVDDAIVMVENVARFIEQGEKPYTAALRGAKQIGFTIVSLTVSLIAVLIPLLFMGGLVGRLFREFAVTLAIAIAISAVLSLTLTAMMSAWILRPHEEPKPGTIAGGFDRLFKAVTRFYETTLAVVLRHRVATLLVTLGTTAVTFVLAMAVPKGFFPIEDTGMIVAVSEAAPDVSFEKMSERQQALAAVLVADPDVATVSSSIGADGINPAANVGRFSIALVPLEERDASAAEIIERLHAAAHRVAGITLYMQPVQDLQVDARISRTQYQYTLEDADSRVLDEFAPKLLAEMRAMPELRDVASDQQAAGLQLHVAVDRDTAGRLGVTTQMLDDTLYDAFGQRIVSTTFTQLNQYRIILEVRPEDRVAPDALDRLYVRSTAGTPVQLSQIARLETRPAPLAIAHQGQFPSVTLSFNTAVDVSLGDAVAAIEAKTRALDPPPTMRASFTGAAQAFRDSLASTPFLILAALITVYIVLGVLYESYIHPITILSTLPSAGVGAILALYVVGKPFDVIALIGVVLLIGIVQKNAIMMIDFALEAEREEGLPPEQAIFKACLLRFRPIMMTTMAALLGGLPLALGSGTGAELRRPLGVTIVGGLLLSQVLTLYTTPVIYLFMEKLGEASQVNISAPFIKRPIGTTLLAIAILLAGVSAYVNLPVAPLPRVDIPTISVSANLPGASPSTMATAVAMPLERRFGRIAGVSEITSESVLGKTEVTVQFDLDKDVEEAAREIQAAIQAAGGDLPPNMPSRPSYRKVNPSDAPILIITLRSKSLEIPDVYEAANTVLAQKIAQVPGVGQVGVGGGVQRAVRVSVDPAVLAGLSLSMEDVRQAMATATANQPKGGVGTEQWHAISSDDQLLDAAGWQQLIVRYDGGRYASQVRLGEIATVTDDVENERVAGWFDGERSISVVIRRQPGANILEVIERIKELLPELAKAIPPSIDVAIAIDRAGTIRASVDEVQFTLLVSMLLVVAVVFVFLRSLRATSIPAVAVPLSLVATFGVMWILDYSLDNLSLMALTIATGFVVDDAIVVTENVSRLIEEGVPPREAALKGAKQIGFTIVSITVSLLAVFIPILFMGGLVGRLFREFAVVLAVSITLSAVISLTLTPMMCAKLLRPVHAKPGLVARGLEAGLDVLVRGYAAVLRVVLRHRIIIGVVTLATVTATVYLYFHVPRGMFPMQDTGMIRATTQGPQDISFTAMKERQEKLIQIVLADPDVAHINANVGGFGGGTGNSGNMFIALVDKPERTTSSLDVIQRLRPKLAKVEGVQMFMTVVQDVRIGGRGSRALYQYTLESADLRELEEWGPKATAALRKVQGVQDVNTDLQTAGLQLDLEIDRDTAARYGITVSQIDNTLYDAFGQRQVATFYTHRNQYRVILEAKSSIGHGPDAIDKVYVTSATGLQVPLSELVRSKPTNVALSVSHQGQFPSTTISFNTAPGVPFATAIEGIRKAMQEIGLPASVHGEFSGTAQAFEDSLDSQPLLIGIALIAVFIVLGVLYESYVHPLTILSTLPSAGLGAVLALLITGSELDLIALVGIILLIGIVKKNAILMVDFAVEREREGVPPEQAIYEACLLRFRPILMTTMAALLGALPLALGEGTGSELRKPLGVAIVGGLAVSQLLTLFTTPVTYLALHRFTRTRKLPDTAEPL